MTISNQYTKDNERIAISIGEPTGIGIEVLLKALNSPKLPKGMEPILVGCKKNILDTYKQLKAKGINSIINPKDLEIEDLPIEELVIPGKPNKATGKASFYWLTRATELVLNKKASALVTAPIAKNIWHKAGHLYPGQTERIAEMTGSKEPSMLFTAVSPISGWRLNTLLATTHIPLADVSSRLSSSLISTKLNTLLHFCKKFHPRPKLAVAGLNPHSGEEGHLGDEESKWLKPLLKEWQKNNPDIELEGPIPPDTCWIPASNAWQGSGNAPNGILALYHDQGLIPVKLIAFEEAVNTTLGLPFIRTSPDHGTAFDIAGKGSARANSMLAALKAAWELK